MLGVVGQQCCVRLHGAFLKKLSMHIRSCCSQISSAFLQQFSSFLQKILSFGYKGKDTALNLCTSVQSYRMYLLINNSDFFTTLLQTSLAQLVSFRNILIGHVMIFQRTVSFKFQCGIHFQNSRPRLRDMVKNSSTKLLNQRQNTRCSCFNIAKHLVQ